MVEKYYLFISNDHDEPFDAVLSKKSNMYLS